MIVVNPKEHLIAKGNPPFFANTLYKKRFKIAFNQFTPVQRIALKNPEQFILYNRFFSPSVIANFVNSVKDKF